MGCKSSKSQRPRLCPKPILDFDDKGDLPNPSVSLTSSTYGVLNLDPPENLEQSSSSATMGSRRSRNLFFNDPSPEIINWTRGEDSEDTGNDAGKITYSSSEKIAFSGKITYPSSSIRPRSLFTPTPKFHGKFSGKESSCSRYAKPLILSETSSRRSLTPFFDPELISFYERQLQQEESEQFPGCSRGKCPYGGEKVAVLYTTTLSGIRKTFNECNKVRSLIESYDVRVIERDVSMDLGFREEMRMLTGSKDARPPVLFVKGRMVGGIEEVMRLEEEGKLGLLLEGIPKADRSCEDCGGLRFVMCKACNGSCKIFVQGEKTKSECGECNENGLVQCASCSKIAEGIPSILKTSYS